VWSSSTDPVPALPLDLFRVLVGVLCASYFVRTYREVADFGDPDGLIDQTFMRRALPFTRLTLLPARTLARTLRLLYVGGCVASTLLALGVETRPMAALLYLLAVSTYRRNFLVTGVDDAIVHLALFWMIVLPVGHTLTVADLWTYANAQDARNAWRTVVVPGFGVRCLLLNLALVYATAGLWKLTSPLWRSGSALRVVLSMPVAYGVSARLVAWPPCWLRLSTYFVLLVEPLGALLFMQHPRSSSMWILAALLIALHVGIIATVRVAIANLALIAAIVSFALAAIVPDAGVMHRGVSGISVTDWVPLGVVICLTGQVLFDACTVAITRSDRVLNPFCVPLWGVGLAQSYRLLDWIDERNYDVAYDIVERQAKHPDVTIPPAAMFPRTMRHVLLQSYLFGNIWMKLNPPELTALRASILARYAARYARRRSLTNERVEVVVHANVRRIHEDGPSLGARTLLMCFAIERGMPAMITTCAEAS
jgi:hypothetical protein